MTDLKLLSGGWMKSKRRFRSFAAALFDLIVVRVQFIIMVNSDGYNLYERMC